MTSPTTLSCRQCVLAAGVVVAVCHPSLPTPDVRAREPSRLGTRASARATTWASLPSLGLRHSSALATPALHCALCTSLHHPDTNHPTILLSHPSSLATPLSFFHCVDHCLSPSFDRSSHPVCLCPCPSERPTVPVHSPQYQSTPVHSTRLRSCNSSGASHPINTSSY